MRRTSTFIGLGATLLATPAFAHVGDHGDKGVAHFMANHGIAAGLVALAIIGAATVIVFKRKG
jgi:hypothetical protein